MYDYDVANEPNEGGLVCHLLTISPKLQPLAVESSSQPNEEDDSPIGDREGGAVHCFNESGPEKKKKLLAMDKKI